MSCTFAAACLHVKQALLYGPSLAIAGAALLEASLAPAPRPRARALAVSQLHKLGRLGDVQDSLAAAERLLCQLNRHDMAETAYAVPPEPFALAVQATCVMLGEPIDWKTSKRMLKGPGFLRRVRDFDKQDIPKKTLRKFSRYYKDERFVPAYLRRISRVACALCAWWRAVYAWHMLTVDMLPLLRAAHARRQLANAAADGNGELVKRPATAAYSFAKEGTLD